MRSVVVEPLASLLARLKIQSWDWLLVGDGSGQTHDQACGWSCVSIEHKTMEREVHIGAANLGTVQFAEMMAYLHTLHWLIERDVIRHDKDGTPRGVKNVHILTDSQYCCHQGRSADRRSAKHSALWHAFDAFNYSGYLLTWHHVDRETVGLNVFTDSHSRAARLLMQHAVPAGPVAQAGEKKLTNVYDYNPEV